MLPKYFSKLHLAVGAIDGDPRIVSYDSKSRITDKYITVPEQEWTSAILNWARMLPKGYVQVLDDYTFCFAGKASSKRHLIQGLRSLADELEVIINKSLIEKGLQIEGEENG